jgi:hypothetical protein
MIHRNYVFHLINAANVEINKRLMRRSIPVPEARHPPVDSIPLPRVGSFKTLQNELVLIPCESRDKRSVSNRSIGELSRVV